MNLPELIDGSIISRYKRFLADVELTDGQVVTAHCPNTGSMKNCWRPGAPVQLSSSDNPKRKLRHTLERVDMGAGWVGVNTSRVNHIVADFIATGSMGGLCGYDEIIREPSYQADGFPSSRFDLLLRGPGRPDCFVEIKNTTLVEDDHIKFPDAKTERGRKHLELLLHAVRAGHRGVIVFAANRPEGHCFRVAADVDPLYDETLRRVLDGGVEIMVPRLHHTGTGVEYGGLVPVCLD